VGLLPWRSCRRSGPLRYVETGGQCHQRFFLETPEDRCATSRQWLIVLVLVGVVIYFLVQVSKSKGSGGSIIETPSDILKKRYAKGEIDKEEFNRKKKDTDTNRKLVYSSIRYDDASIFNLRPYK
jgi:hypothetical protein